MYPYQEWVLQTIKKHTDLKGKKVLEIGGVPGNHSVAEEMIANGACEVTLLNNRLPHPEGTITENIHYKNGDARNLDFADESFDIIWGTAVLEHLLDIDLLLDELYRVLTVNGIVCMHGGPIWSSKWGHHLWVHIDNTKYEFNGNNPIQDWSHLYMSQSEMTAYLQLQDIPKAHIEKITQWCFDSDQINRMTYGDFVHAFERAKLSIYELTNKIWEIPSPKVLAALKGKNSYSSKLNLSIGEILVALKKEES